MSDAKIAEVPSAITVQLRRQACENNRRLTAPRGSNQSRQALPSNRCGQLLNRLIPTEKPRRLIWSEISQAWVGGGGYRFDIAFVGWLFRAMSINNEVLDHDRLIAHR